MGIFSDIKAAADVQRIKAGGIAKLSIAQIVNLIINLPDANKKLSSEEFNQISGLFKEMRKCTTKMPMTMDLYCDTAVKIILEFDKIAPYEKFSGGNEIEFSFMMADILGKNHRDIRRLKREIYKLEMMLDGADKAYENNKKIISDALSDEVLSQMENSGQITAEKAEEYRQNRRCVEMFLQTAPSFRASTVERINLLKAELKELE